jgi:hypothetical protein
VGLAFKTLYDTVILDADRRVVGRREGEIPFQEIAAVEVAYSPRASYSAESYPVYIQTRDGSRIEIANDAFGAARRVAVEAAGTLEVPIRDSSFGKLSTSTAEAWSLPLRERLRGRIVPVPSLESPGDDVLCSRLGDAVRFDVRPGVIARTLRRGALEMRSWDLIDWSWTSVVAVLFLIPCLMVLPVVLVVYLVSRLLQGHPLTASLTVSPAEVRLGGGLVAPEPIGTGAIQDVELFWRQGWRGRLRLWHVVVRSDAARLEFPVEGEAEASWIRQHILAVLARS